MNENVFHAIEIIHDRPMHNLSLLHFAFQINQDQSQLTEVNLSQLRYVGPSVHRSVGHTLFLPILDLLSFVKVRSSSD